MHRRLGPTCAICNGTSPLGFVCARCKSVYLCSTPHQALYWTTHQYMCNPVQRLESFQPPLLDEELRRYVRGDDGELSTASSIERFARLRHPKTKGDHLIAAVDVHANDNGALWEKYRQIQVNTPLWHQDDIIGHVRATLLADARAVAEPPPDTRRRRKKDPMRPFAEVADLLLDPLPTAHFCRSSSLKLVFLEPDHRARDSLAQRSLFELQALTTVSLVVQGCEAWLVDEALGKLFWRARTGDGTLDGMDVVADRARRYVLDARAEATRRTRAAQEAGL